MANGVKEGAGTIVDPFIIRDTADFLAFSNWSTATNIYAVQVADITFTTTQDVLLLVPKTNVNYNGNNFFINDLVINSSSGNSSPVCIFNTGNFSNIKFKNLSIRSSNGDVYALALSPTSFINVHVINGSLSSPRSAYGFCNSATNISDCSFEGSIYAGANASGFVNTIVNSSNSYIRRSSFKGSISGTVYIAGIACSSTFSFPIVDCYVDADIKDLGSTGVIGGILSQTTINNTGISRCYSKGSLNGAYRVGGIVGQTTSANTLVVNNCFCLLSSITRPSGTSIYFGDICGYYTNLDASTCRTVDTLVFIDGTGVWDGN